MEGFKKLVPKKCKVLRDGTVLILEAEELVPGKEAGLGGAEPSHCRLEQLAGRSQGSR